MDNTSDTDFIKYIKLTHKLQAFWGPLHEAQIMFLPACTAHAFTFLLHPPTDASNHLSQSLLLPAKARTTISQLQSEHGGYGHIKASHKVMSDGNADHAKLFMQAF